MLHEPSRQVAGANTASVTYAVARDSRVLARELQSIDVSADSPLTQRVRRRHAPCKNTRGRIQRTHYVDIQSAFVPHALVESCHQGLGLRHAALGPRSSQHQHGTGVLAHRHHCTNVARQHLPHRSALALTAANQIHGFRHRQIRKHDLSQLGFRHRRTTHIRG